jgi:hypothetical protein
MKRRIAIGILGQNLRTGSVQKALDIVNLGTGTCFINIQPKTAAFE